MCSQFDASAIWPARTCRRVICCSSPTHNRGIVLGIRSDHSKPRERLFEVGGGSGRQVRSQPISAPQLLAIEPDGIANLPSRLVQFLEGEWQALADFAKDSRRVSIQAMPILMDFASGGCRLDSTEKLRRCAEQKLCRRRGHWRSIKTNPRKLGSDLVFGFQESCSQSLKLFLYCGDLAI